MISAGPNIVYLLDSCSYAMNLHNSLLHDAEFLC